jgi:hypothetical protein
MKWKKDDQEELHARVAKMLAEGREYMEWMVD